MCYIPFPPLWINRTEMVVLTFIFFFSCNIVYNVWGLMNAIAENKSIPLKCKKKKIKKNWNLRNFYQGEINGNNNFFFFERKKRVRFENKSVHLHFSEISKIFSLLSVTSCLWKYTFLPEYFINLHFLDGTFSRFLQKLWLEELA